MLKCLYCEYQCDSNEILNLKYLYPAVYYVDPKDQPAAHSLFHCSNGHLVGVSKKRNEPFVLYKMQWWPGIPGSLTHLHIFDFYKKKWNIINICDTEYKRELFEEYIKQQNILKAETFVSRLEWLKCSLRLNTCKDIRLLIAKEYIKPSEFWKREESSLFNKICSLFLS